MNKDTLTLKQLMLAADKLSDKMLSDLEDGFKRDFTIEETCLFAGIHKDTYYEWRKRSDEFATRMDRATSFVVFAAKRNIAQRIVNEESVEDSWKYLSRKQKNLYSLRTELTGNEGKEIIVTFRNSGTTDGSTTAETARGAVEII